MIKAIILDFDGVIVDSMDVKAKAFRELFKDHPQHLDEIVNYHLEHGAISRYDKFSYIYENILGKKLTNEEKKELGEKFSESVLGKILECPFIPGVLEFLDEYSKKVKLYVASGTPEEELEYIINEKGLEQYFVDVYGSPLEKHKIIKKIMVEESIEKNQILYVGDSPTDLKAAKQMGVNFIGMSSGFGKDYEHFSESDLTTAQDFFELVKILENQAM